MHVQIAHALDLKQIQRPPSDQPLVLPHLPDARHPPVRVDLRGDEEAVTELRRRQNLAELGVDLRRARRSIDDPAAVLEEHPDHRRHGLGPLGRDLEHGLRRAKANDGQGLVGAGDGAGGEGGLGPQPTPPHSARRGQNRSEARHAHEEVAACRFARGRHDTFLRSARAAQARRAST